MIRAILFDKDGTLLDFQATWLPPYREAAEYLANEFPRARADALLEAGGYITAADGWRTESVFASGSNRDIMDVWARTIGQELNSAQRARIAQIFQKGADAYHPATPDLRACLAALKARGMQLGLATMDDEESARRMLRALNLGDLFDFYCGADSGHGEKPEPGMLLAFCRACDVAPDETMMVGDSPRDLHMGRRAGAGLCVGVLSGTHARDDLAPHADAVLDNIGQLENFLDR